MLGIHKSKSEDYVGTSDTFANFTDAAYLVNQFTDPIDQVFATLIGIKISRLGSLSREGKAPNNESMQDTRIDLANYAALWAAYHE